MISGIIALIMDYQDAAEAHVISVWIACVFASFFVVFLLRGILINAYELYRHAEDRSIGLADRLQPRLEVSIPAEKDSELIAGKTSETYGGTLYSSISSNLPTVCIGCRNVGEMALQGVTVKVTAVEVDGVPVDLFEAVQLSATPSPIERLAVDLSPNETVRFWVGRATNGGGFFLMRQRQNLQFQQQRLFSQRSSIIDISVVVSSLNGGTPLLVKLRVTTSIEGTEQFSRGKASAALLSVLRAGEVMEDQV